MSSDELLNLKYSDLQKLAKTHGIKANQKSEKLIEALKLIITSEKKTSKEIINEEIESRDVDDSKVVVESENKTDASSTKRRSSTSKSRQNSAKKSPKNKADSTPRKGKDKTVHPANGSPSPKRAASPGKPTPAKDEDAEGPVIAQSSSASKNTRSSQRKEGPYNNSVQEQSKKRQRESSEVEEQFEPMKKRLRSSVETKETVAEKDVAKQTTAIPRYAKLLKAQKKTSEYWSKIHQRNQEKMESIEEYQQKKQTRAALLLSGEKKNKARTTRVLGSRTSPRLTAVVKPLTDKAFMPQVLTTDKMDLNFGKRPSTVRKNSPGKPLNNTFARDKSPGFKTPRNQRDSPPSKNTGSNLRTSMFSPRPAGTNVSSASKSKFDLAKSLERPLTWVPYRGRIKPIEEENPHRVDVKEVRTRSRQQRAVEARSGWKSKRASELMKRRCAK